MLAELFVAPRRRSSSSSLPLDARIEHLNVGKRRVRVHLLGEGPLVVLVHDWQGSAAQLLGLARALARGGFRAALFDMPAHGEAPGLTTSLPEFLNVVREVGARLGPVHALIGHGLGGLTALLRAAHLPGVAVVVALAPLPSFEFAIHAFARSFGLSLGEREHLTQRLERRLGLRRDDADLSQLASTVPTLLVHDVLDREVPVRHTRQLSLRWRNARIMETSGLGHRRILQAPAVIHLIGSFLRTAPSTNAALGAG